MQSSRCSRRAAVAVVSVTNADADSFCSCDRARADDG